MPASPQVLEWLRAQCSQYVVEPVAIYRRGGTHSWPFHADSEEELANKLDQGGHFLPLPKEPAALANIIEVAIVDFILARVHEEAGANAQRGTERGYPDLELFGPRFGDGFHAIDVKVARRARSKRKTQSRITLYTGNTYFRHPTIQWPGTFRPFQQYRSHLDVIALYTLEDTNARLVDFELIVQEPWRIASKQRSSTTREYLGAVQDIEKLREGRGEFESEQAFYQFWRKYKFKVGIAVQQQLDKAMKRQASAIDDSQKHDEDT